MNEPLYTSLKRYLCPQHAELVKADLLALVQGAKVSIDVGIYGFAWKPLVDLLIQKHKDGVKVRIVLDRTQAGGVGEREYIQEIVDAGIEHYIGTSEQHQIRHTKNIIVDGTHGECGSLNYSESGFRQNNTVELFTDIALAKFTTDDLEENIAWLVANEPQYQQLFKEPAALNKIESK